MPVVPPLSRAAASKLPLNQRIIWARNRADISQEWLALSIGTSRRHMIRIEGGQSRPGPVFRARIAEVTGQPPEFFEDEEVAA